MRDLTDVTSFRSRLQSFQRPVNHETAGRVPPKTSRNVAPVTTWQPPCEPTPEKREVVRREEEVDTTPVEHPATEASLAVASTLNGQVCELPLPKAQPKPVHYPPLGVKVGAYFHRLSTRLYTLVGQLPYVTPKPVLKRNKYTVSTWCCP